MEVTVKVCPICGKAPKVRLNENLHMFKPATYEATIKCKPFLRKSHLAVDYTSNEKDDAIDHAVRHWNGLASTIVQKEIDRLDQIIERSNPENWF